MDYGFCHAGKVFTPNGTAGISPAENDERNKAIERAELEHWKTAPQSFLAYYVFPAEKSGGEYRRSFSPRRYSNLGSTPTADIAYVQTWLGTKIGDITTARVYAHNLGGRFVTLRVRGTNGAEYFGRASWDNGNCVRLRRVKGGR